MRRLAALPIVALLALVVAGCGGGGGSIAPASDPIRQIQPGDELTYTTYVYGPIVNPDTAVKAVHSLDTAPPVYGNRRFRIDVEGYDVQNGVIIVDDDPRRFTAYVEQDADGTTYETPYQRTPTNEVGKPVSIPGTLRIGDAFSYRCDFVEGGTYRITTRVVGIESVDGYTAYKLHSESVSLNVDGIARITESTDTWVVPEIGHMVKSVTSSIEDGQHYTVQTRLVSRNF